MSRINQFITSTQTSGTIITESNIITPYPNNKSINEICTKIFKEYSNCMKSGIDKEICKKYKTQLKQCVEIF